MKNIKKFHNLFFANTFCFCIFVKYIFYSFQTKFQIKLVFLSLHRFLNINI
jgi:hypothetical protein